MSRFQPTLAYRVFLELLVQTRNDAGVKQDELATRLELSTQQVAAFELGHKQLDFVQTRQWCLALGASFLEFMIELDTAIATEELFDTPDADDAPAPDPDDAPDTQNPTEGGAK